MASPFDDIFGSATATSAPAASAQQWRQTLRLDDLERQHNLPAGLMTSVLRQESGGDPRVKSSAGAQGLFQFMPATAAQYKIDPLDPEQAAPAAAKELSTLYRKYGGDVDRTLAAWNWGQGNVDRKGMANAPAETRGFLTNVKRFMSPGVAEAATPPDRGPGQAQQAAHSAVWEDIFGGQQPTPATRASQAGGQTPAGAHVAPGASQGPGTSRLSLGDPTEAASETEAAATIARLRASQAGAVGAQPQPADLSALAVGGGPSQQAPTVTDPAALLAVGGGPARPKNYGLRPLAKGDVPAPLPPGVPTIEQDTPQEGFTKPSTLIPLLMGGAGIKAATRAMGEVAPWVGRVVRPVAEGLSQTLGFGTGRVAETGQLPSPGELATELAVTTAAGRVLEDIGAVGADVLRRSKGGKAIMAADEATQAARAKWQAEVDAAEGAATSQQKELYETGVIKARAAQREYEMAARARREKIAANQTEYDQAVRAEQESRYAQRRQEIGEQQADYQAKELARTHEMARRQQEYTGAIAGQEQAITQARAIPGRYAPETPSWVLYEKYGDAAKDAVVDLAPAKTALSELRAQHGVLPDGTLRPFPKPVEDIASKLEKASGDTPFETIRQELRKLGPLTRSADGNVRGPAKQLMGIYADVLDAAPIANDALKTANATFRREMAVRDMDDWLKPGHGVVARDRYGREKINVPALFKKIDKTMADDSLFRGSFSPAERQALEADIGKLAGTPTMPTKPPGTPAITPVPQPELLPGSAPQVRQGLQTPPREPAPVPLPGDVRVPQVPVPAGAAAPVPTTPADQLGPRPPVAAKATSLGLMLVAAHELGVPFAVTSKLAVANAVLVGGQQARWLMAHALLDPGRRKLMQAAIDGQGILNPRFYGVMLATLSPAEKQAMARETGGGGQR